MESKIASKFRSKNGGWNLRKEAAREHLWEGGGRRDPRSLTMIIIGNH